MKKVLSLILCLAMVFSLAACQEKEVISYFTIASNFTDVTSQETSGSVDLTIETDGILALIDLGQYLSEDKDIKDYKPSEIDEETKETIDKVFETIGSNKISASWEGKLAKDESSQLKITTKLGDKKLFEGEFVLKDNIAYISSEAITKTLENVLDLVADELEAFVDAEEVSEIIKELDIETDYIKVADLKETMEQASEMKENLAKEKEDEEKSDKKKIDFDKVLEIIKENPEEYNKFLKSVAKPMDDLMVSFATPFVTENNGEYTIKLNVGTLKSDLETTWNNAKKNPKKLYDKVLNFTNAVTSTELGNELYGEMLKETKEKLNNKKELIKEWKNKDFNTFYNDLTEDFDDKWLEILNGTSVASTISQKDNSFTNKYTAKVVISGKTLFTVNSTTNVKSVDLSTIDIKDLDKSLTIEEVVEDMYSSMDFGYGYDDYDYDYDFEDEDFDYDFDDEDLTFEWDDEDLEEIEFDEDFSFDNDDEYMLDLKSFNIKNTDIISIMEEFDFEDYNDVADIEDKYKSEFRTISKKYIDGNVNTYSDDDYISFTNESKDYTKEISLSLAESYEDVEISLMVDHKDLNNALSEMEKIMKEIMGVEMDADMKDRIIKEASDNVITEEYLYGSAESKNEEYSIDYGYAEYDDSFSLNVSLMHY